MQYSQIDRRDAQITSDVRSVVDAWALFPYLFWEQGEVYSRHDCKAFFFFFWLFCLTRTHWLCSIFRVYITVNIREAWSCGSPSLFLRRHMLLLFVSVFHVLAFVPLVLSLLQCRQWLENDPEQGHAVSFRLVSCSIVNIFFSIAVFDYLCFHFRHAKASGLI